MALHAMPGALDARLRGHDDTYDSFVGKMRSERVPDPFELVLLWRNYTVANDALQICNRSSGRRNATFGHHRH